MVPEISTTTYRVFSHLWPFFALLPANSPQNENIKKNEKETPGDIIILQKYTKNHDYIL